MKTPVWKELLMRWMRGLMGLATAATLSFSSASAADLIMVRQAGCPWCAVWDREIGPIYGKTEIGRRAPLRMADLHERLPITLKSPVIYTPTFLLIEKNREVGRIEGYAGDHFFWGLLERLLDQLPVEHGEEAPG